MSTVYYTATTLDGFLADPQDSLDWLFVQDHDPAGPMSHDEFMTGVGAIVMGATTYQWILDRMASHGEPWSYAQPTWVFTHRELEPAADTVRMVSGAVAPVHHEMTETAAGRDIWVVGGGELAGAFADAGLLDQVMVSIAPVTLGAGRPLFPRRHQLRLIRLERNGGFVCGWYDLVGPGEWPTG